jgi:5-methylcytosine-specific restriction endonuclease McrA
MRIGQLVRQFLPKIFEYCENVDAEELSRLMLHAYSLDTFHLTAYPFCQEISKIETNQSCRYWTQEFKVQGKTIRVCSQWFVRHKPYFVQYLITKGIVNREDVTNEALSIEESVTKHKQEADSKKSSRYKNIAIGNAQNLVVRNILSNLGRESFSEKDWNKTKAYFLGCCAYCGREKKLEMDHAVPINKQMMGEHRLGNLIPSCQTCNKEKAGKDFREFLGTEENRIQKIEAYMDSKEYEPLDDEHVAELLEMAYREVSDVAVRYIAIINRILEK